MGRPVVDQPMGQPKRVINIASHIKTMADLSPERDAVIVPTGRDGGGRVTYARMSFARLEEDSNRIASGLEALGLVKGTKTIVMVRPSLDFISLTFALFKVGAVPVMVDPGMGLRRMLHCYRSTDPEAFIGIPPAHVVRLLFRRTFRGIRHKVTVGVRWFWGGTTLARLRAIGDPRRAVTPTGADECAAILFTTGSTGPPKGVVYTHGIFDAQVRYLKDCFGIRMGEIDVATFPLFALFGPALGMTVFIPDMDPIRPASVHPPNIIEPIQDLGATTMFGSPALLKRVARYGTRKGVHCPSLRRVISAGAPVPIDVMRTLHAMLPADAAIWTPYGATEALPVCATSSTELLGGECARDHGARGICVGKPMPGHEVHIIRISDEGIPHWSEDLRVEDGEVGEIVVKGSIVTRAYHNLPDETARAKIRDGAALFHRMGDLGWKDEKGRIWFCGRKAHRVVTSSGTLFTVPCEAVFNRHEAVFRSALVGVGGKGAQIPVILIELEADATHRAGDTLAQEILALGSAFAHTEPIERLLFHPGFPVDIRHNAKISREVLAAWAGRRLKKAYRKHPPGEGRDDDLREQ